LILAHKLLAAGRLGEGPAGHAGLMITSRSGAARRCYNIPRGTQGCDRTAQLEKILKQILEYIESFATVVLVLAGIGGISFHLFRDDGWLEMAFGNIFELHVQYPLIAIPVTFAAIIMIRMWRQNLLAHGKLRQLPNIFIYTLMAVGVYFIGYFWINGSL